LLAGSVAAVLRWWIPVRFRHVLCGETEQNRDVTPNLGDQDSIRKRSCDGLHGVKTLRIYDGLVNLVNCNL